MPCYDPRDAPGYESRQRGAADERERLQPRIDRLTALLCGTCKALLKMNLTLGPELDFWYAEHKRADQHRQAKERREDIERAKMQATRDATVRQEELNASIRNRVASQMTPEERAAFGIEEES